MAKKKYEDNPSREANILLGAGLGGLTGGLFFGPLGALVVGGTFAAIGSQRDIFGDNRKFLENQQCPRGTEVQTLIFSKRDFTRAQAVAWARRNNFVVNKVDETGESYRIRSGLPSRFMPGSFRTITLTDGVKAVVGCRRS